MNVQQAVVDGALLSDAGLQYIGWGSRFDLAQAGIEHMDWLESVAYALRLSGVSISPGYPKLASRTLANGEHYVWSRLRTRASPYLSEQFSRWYSDGHKEVPADIEITPATLANWFMGDGSSSIDKRDNHAPSVAVFLCTECFNEDSIAVLVSKLSNLYINTGRAQRNHGVRITILQDSVNLFMNMVKPYIVPSFLYKIKLRVAREEATRLVTR